MGIDHQNGDEDGKGLVANVTGHTTRIAVIGFGPRGLGALEALADNLPRDDQRVVVDVFDSYNAPGAGPNFDPRESPLCLLNIPNRDIAIDPPAFSRCGSFSDWQDGVPDPDSFPTRPDLGRYLQARFDDLRDYGSFGITLVSERVARIERRANGWCLDVAGRWSGPYDEVLLTLGQPEVLPDPQLEDWQDHALHSCRQIADAYPARHLIENATQWCGGTVAIRGLGLSTFDVLRALSMGQGGRFGRDGYQASGREPDRILPFSLDGKPPFPKPETASHDKVFAPTTGETAAFSKAIAHANLADPDTARQLINDALVPVVRRVLRHDGAGDATLCQDWLSTEWDSPGAQETDGPYTTLATGIELATGKRSPTIGYAIGQIWRKWQNELRTGFNPNQSAPETAKALIDFDEGLKRYSYGPPVASARELKALIDAGLVDLDLAADPEIRTVKGGWSIRKNDALADVSVMINAVLPSPNLSDVTATLVSDLLADGTLAPLAEGLAAMTASDGSVVGADGTASPGLCLLGRLALGSVIAPDSLHDCFGAASRRWARGVLRRMG